MVNNELYHKEDEAMMTGTHSLTHSKISDYNTLGERDYEVIDVKDECKQDYNLLHRPSPPVIAGVRNATFMVVSSKEFHSMSTLTSQVGTKVNKGVVGQAAMPTESALQQDVANPDVRNPLKSASVEPECHVYRELEHNVWNFDSPSPTVAPHANAARNVPTTPSVYQTLDDATSANNARSVTHKRGTGMLQGINGIDKRDPHEGFISLSHTAITLESAQYNRIQHGGLENKPETGHVFTEPLNPTSFPVHKYEKISSSDYEVPTPIKSTPMSLAPALSLTGECERRKIGGRYEMEHDQSFKDDTTNNNQLKPISVDEDYKNDSLLFPNSETCFPSLGVEERSSFIESQADQGNNANHSLAFDNPTSVSLSSSFQEHASDFNAHTTEKSIDRPQNISLTSDFLSSHINHFQHDRKEENRPTRGPFMDETITYPEADGQVNERVETSPITLGVTQMEMKEKTWREERQDHNSLLLNGSTHPVLSDEHRDMRESHQFQSQPPRTCRNIHMNGDDLGHAEYTRSVLKTVV